MFDEVVLYIHWGSPYISPREAEFGCIGDWAGRGGRRGGWMMIESIVLKNEIRCQARGFAKRNIA